MVVSRWIEPQQVAGEQRDAHVQLEVALHPADGDRRVVADDLGGTCRTTSGITGLTLPGHDRRALLQLGEEDLAQAGSAGRCP